jgi:hypothetical protein
LCGALVADIEEDWVKHIVLDAHWVPARLEVSRVFFCCDKAPVDPEVVTSCGSQGFQSSLQPREEVATLGGGAAASDDLVPGCFMLPRWKLALLVLKLGNHGVPVRLSGAERSGAVCHWFDNYT